LVVAQIDLVVVHYKMQIHNFPKLPKPQQTSKSSPLMAPHFSLMSTKTSH